MLLFFTLNREDFSFVIHLDRQPRTSRRREAQTGSRARSGSRSERTLDAVEHSRTLMEWWPFLIFHRGGLRIKVINNICSADLASSRNTASISTPQTSQTLPLEVPARVPHKKDDQDSTQPHRVESIKSLGDFSFSSSSTCDAILHRHRMSLQRNIATGYDFFNGLLAFKHGVATLDGGSTAHIREHFLGCEWFEVYDFLEFVVGYFKSELQLEPFNRTLERELSGYRFVSGHITDITNAQEREMLETVLADSRFAGSFRAHGTVLHLPRQVEKALSRFLDRVHFDFVNVYPDSDQTRSASGREATVSRS